MQSKDELLRSAQRAVAMRRQRAIMAANEMQQRVRAEIPGYAAAEDTIQQCGYKAARLAATGAGSAAVEAALSESKEAQARCDRLLQEAGWAKEMLKPPFVCQKCHDQGILNGMPCECIHDLERQMRREEITKASALSISSFEGMDIQRYPETFDSLLGCTVRQHMSSLLQSLKDYAQSFSPRSGSLLFCGNAGLGKTHAALAIAGVVLNKGYDVIYISSQELFGHLEKVEFDSSSSSGQDSMMDAVLGADLLILDDLGTEFLSPYVSSCLYTILNSRIARKRPTIYTTNITDPETFAVRYTEKIASRLTGSCEPVYFVGADIRQMSSEA